MSDSTVQDFMPIQNFDYLEFYVGNAKQAAYYFSNAWGFTPIAYAGLETGLRDRSSYVLEQGNVRLVLTSALGPEGEIAEQPGPGRPEAGHGHTRGAAGEVENDRRHP